MRKYWLLVPGSLLVGLIGLEAQSALAPVYTTADAWDCAGGSSCPKPIGVLDGKNAAFTLRAAPSGSAAVDVYLNGIRQRIGADYTLTGSAGTILTFSPPPAKEDTVDVRYRENAKASILPQ